MPIFVKYKYIIGDLKLGIVLVIPATICFIWLRQE